MTSQPWVGPGLDKLMRGDLSGFTRMATNTSFLNIAFAWSYLHTILIWPLAAYGLVRAVGNRQWRPLGLVLLALLAYLGMTAAVSGFDATARSRTPYMPFIFAFAGLACACVSQGFGRGRRE